MELNIRSKRGFTTLLLFFFIAISFIIVVIFGTFFYGLEVYDNVSRNITLELGDINFTSTYADTLGSGISATLNALTISAMAIIAGMIIVMLLISFRFKQNNTLLIVLDIFIIIVAFVAAIYISQSFDTFINSSSEFLDIYSVDFDRPSRFILNLPTIVAILGALMMMINYIPIFKRGEPNVLQF